MSYIILYSPLIIVIVIWIIVKHIYTYWDRQGIVNVCPRLIYGNLRPTVKYQRTFPNNINDLYWDAISVPYIGIYLLCRPALLIRDLKIIKRVMSDSECFNHRGIYSSETDPMSINLFSSVDNTKLHSAMLQIFTLQKIELLYEAINREGEHLTHELGKYVNEPVVLNLHKLLQTYTLNVIGSVFFGLDINIFEDLSHEFNYFNEQMCKSGWMSRIKQAQAFLYPK